MVVKKQTSAKKAPVNKAPAKKTEKPSVKEAPKTQGKKTTGGFTIFPAGWEKEERHQFIAFLLGMIVAGAVMWGYIQLTTFDEDMTAKDKLQTVIVRDIHRVLFGNKPRRGRVVRKKRAAPAVPCGNPRNVVFNESEYQPYAGKGNQTLTGNVCNGLPKGVACPEKTVVFVNPVTSYSTEWYDRHWVANEMLALPDQRAWAYQRRTEARKGNFAFAELPAGSYYVGSAACLKLNEKDERCTPIRMGVKVQLNGKATAVQVPVVFIGKMIPPPPPPPHKAANS